ncbi:FAD-binding oxidoreductase [Sphingomonas gei]|uniref:FAD-binding oxidoreductase n=1 Tax=Sphingomonas gei TaxID=1395960 RepID=A0A4S1WYV1_9SPHN|nr:FAD-binding oxidoreductase [Sphingomonas gei]TGX48739.1 FAD-binding oxidoreductase [Sphingomonas gei]
MTFQPDIAVIGAGIAGSSIASHLAAHRKVQLFEMEAQPGYHSTGRSAAIFSEAYGNETIRAFTRASRDFFYAPPAGFASAPLVTPRHVLVTARDGQEDALDHFTELARAAGHVEPVSIDAALALCPILRREVLSAAVLSTSPADIDVNELQQGYLRLFRQHGGVATMASEIVGLERDAQGWRILTANGEFRAPIIVNAAGAWAGEIGMLAGATDIGLQPLKRTACLIDPPVGHDISAWPMLLDVEEEFYLKPDAGMLLLSPADESVAEPCDAQPDELDIAIAVDRLERATTLKVRRIASKWAGLRSFVADRSPVIGFDRQAQDFFWFAALGGYGIQTAPASSRIAAGLILGNAGERDLDDFGIERSVMSPDRLVSEAAIRT